MSENKRVTIPFLAKVLKPIVDIVRTKADKTDIVQSDWSQTDTEQNDFIKNKPAIDDTLSVAGAVADAKATGEAIAAIDALVGDTAVSTQINDAVSKITPENIGALNAEDYYGIVRKEGGLVFADSLEGLAMGMVSDIVPLQSGVGDPSPDNIRLISGWNVISLWHGAAYDETAAATLTAVLPETVYGGSLDWTSGVLTVTHRCIELTGSENWRSNGSTNQGQFYVSGYLAADVAATDSTTTGIGSHYKYGGAYYGTNSRVQVRSSILWLVDTGLADVDALKAYLAEQMAAGTPVTIVYELATPYTIQLTPQQLEAIDGANYVWSDCGDTCVTFNYTPFLDFVNTKVDKVDGMGLSTNDYTTAEKDKLSGIEDGANKTVIDAELSNTSTNPVQNQVISAAIDDLNALVGDTTVSNQISNAIADLVNGAPTTLDTLGEIATAMEENADVVAALDSAIGSKANADDLTSHINDRSNPHGVTLNQLNVTATAEELNYVSGVTGNIQTQFDELSVDITDDEIDAICGATLEFDGTLTDEITGTVYKLYVSEGKLKMTEVTE